MIKIESDVLTFEFKHHINVIGGFKSLGDNSGRFKTALFENLNTAFESANLKCNYKVIFLDFSLGYSLLNYSFSGNECYIVDEMNFKPQELNYMFKQIKAVNGYAIIIGRLNVPQLQYGIDAIYCLTSDRTPYILRPAFEGLLDNPCIKYDKIVTEDSPLIAQLYNTVLNVSIQSANGNTKFYKQIKETKNPLLIIDNDKFGTHFLKLLERLDLNKICTINLFAPACFEEFLLTSVEECDSMVENHVLNGIEFPVFDSEDYCEDQIKEICFKYRKKTLILFIQCMTKECKCQNPCKFDLNKSHLIKLLHQMINGKPFSYSGSNLICYSLDSATLRALKEIDNKEEENTLSFNFKSILSSNFKNKDNSIEYAKH